MQDTAFCFLIFSCAKVNISARFLCIIEMSKEAHLKFPECNFHHLQSCEVWIVEGDRDFGEFVGRIKGAKCPFDLQFLTWDFS